MHRSFPAAPTSALERRRHLHALDDEPSFTFCAPGSSDQSRTDRGEDAAERRGPIRGQRERADDLEAWRGTVGAVLAGVAIWLLIAVLAYLTVHRFS